MRADDKELYHGSSMILQNIYPVESMRNRTWTNFDLDQIESICSRQILCCLIISTSGREENIVGKGENAGDQHFLLFPTMI